MTCGMIKVQSSSVVDVSRNRTSPGRFSYIHLYWFPMQGSGFTSRAMQDFSPLSFFPLLHSFTSIFVCLFGT